MASSSSNDHSGQYRPQRLVRQNSSFIGAIKNIVSKPLTWFSNDDAASAGDRRKRSIEPAPEVVQEQSASDDLDVGMADTRNTKRRKLATQTDSLARKSSVVPRASSAVLPSRTRATLSPRRQTMQRTMSIDPPLRTIPAGAFNFTSNDVSMDSIRDVSMPLSPLSPRPSFRMRSSLTPQPNVPPGRHFSEPPPLGSLISHPVFVHAPPAPQQPEQPQPTLGTLVENVRSSRTPAPRQQHSSLLFAAPASSSEAGNHDLLAPAERALHQLDIYKTPLLPTRMRSHMPASVTATVVPDMFKSRRSAQLVLDDANDRSKASKGNDTKPYAGQGGMKKLLARRKLEVQGSPTQLKEQDVQTEDLTEQQAPQNLPSHSSPPRESTSTTAVGSDWLGSLSSRAPATSSLRVGRTKITRNHIQRPAKKKFSAVYEDEGDDAMEGEDSKREREALEEAAKKSPAFNLPPDFSFAKEVPPVNATDLEDAKEPPIASLPFSFAKAPAAEKSSVEVLEPVVGARPVAPSSGTPFSFGTPPAASSGPSSSNPTKSIPNFFANSQALAKAPEIKLPTQPITSLSSSQPPATLFSFGASPPTPSASASEQHTQSSTRKPKDTPQVQGKTREGQIPNFFGNLTQEKDSRQMDSQSAPSSDANGAAAPFSFSASKPNGSVFGAQQSMFENQSSGQATKSDSPPNSLFGGNTSTSLNANPFSESLKATSSETPKATSPFGQPAQATSSFAPPANPLQSTPSPLPFGFGQPSDTSKAATQPAQPFASSEPKIDAPKPVLGGTSAFTFGQPSQSENKEVKSSAPFAFGSTSNTPSTPTESKPPVFSFGQSSTTPAASPVPTGFSFGAGSTAADVSVKPPFVFGQPTQTSATQRPVTPPKNNDVEFRMEESPTRDLQQSSSSKPFSFGGGAGSGFGTQSTSSAPAPFSFGPSSATANPFAQKDTSSASAEPKPFAFGTSSAPAPAPISTSFSFGNPAVDQSQRPSSGGGFTFTTTTPTPTTPSAAFNFGALPANPNPFGAPQTGSAPSSPSTFNQPSPFAFGAPSAAPAASAFSFGSQPASPAAGAPTNLPVTGFGGSGFGTSSPQPSSPFAAPISLAPSTSSGGTPLFTMGAPPTANQARRPTRNLPNRRATGKR